MKSGLATWRSPPQGEALGPRSRPAGPAPCHFFARGLCNKGDNCVYSHAGSSKATTSKDIMSADPPRPQLPCRFFADGRCAKGEKCLYAHIQPTTVTSEESRSEHIETLTDPGLNIVCKFFARGACLHGDLCAFPHSQGPKGNSEWVMEGRVSIHFPTDLEYHPRLIMGNILGGSGTRDLDSRAWWRPGAVWGRCGGFPRLTSV